MTMRYNHDISLADVFFEILPVYLMNLCPYQQRTDN